MTSIARELDEKLTAMDPATASMVERFVRDALNLVEAQVWTPAGPGEVAAHRKFLEQFAGALVDEPIERPPQGNPEERGAW